MAVRHTHFVNFLLIHNCDFCFGIVTNNSDHSRIHVGERVGIRRPTECSLPYRFSCIFCPISPRRITSVLSERRTQFANERRSEVKYQTLSIASVATNQIAGLLRFGSTHCYLACFIKTARRTGNTRSASSPSILQ